MDTGELENGVAEQAGSVARLFSTGQMWVGALVGSWMVGLAMMLSNLQQVEQREPDHSPITIGVICFVFFTIAPCFLPCAICIVPMPRGAGISLLGYLLLPALFWIVCGLGVGAMGANQAEELSEEVETVERRSNWGVAGACLAGVIFTILWWYTTYELTLRVGNFLVDMLPKA